VLDIPQLLQQVQQAHVQLLASKQGRSAASMGTPEAQLGVTAGVMGDLGATSGEDPHRLGPNPQPPEASATAESAAAVGAVPQQRLFVALLNLAHQNNLAATQQAAAGGRCSSAGQLVGTAGAAAGGGGAVARGRGRVGRCCGQQPAQEAVAGVCREACKRGEEGQELGAEGGSKGDAGSTCVAWLPGTAITLAAGEVVTAPIP
jgi:hypothetical protein